MSKWVNVRERSERTKELILCSSLHLTSPAASSSVCSSVCSVFSMYGLSVTLFKSSCR